MLTWEVIKLIQYLHDNWNKGQVELSNMGPDLKVLVAKICIMAAQQGVYRTNGFFMEEENTVGKKKKKKSGFMYWASSTTAFWVQITYGLNNRIKNK